MNRHCCRTKACGITVPYPIDISPEIQASGGPKMGRSAGIVVRPVGHAITGGVRLAHAIRLTAWTRDVNPLPSEFSNNAT